MRVRARRPDIIDSALLRPGRLDQLIYIPLPDEGQPAPDLQGGACASRPSRPTSTSTCSSSTSNGFSGADITEICQRACKCAQACACCLLEGLGYKSQGV